MILCPNCKGEYLSGRIVSGLKENVKIDVCPICKGVWFDKDELEKIDRNAFKELRPPSDSIPTDRLCPRCDKEMRMFRYPQTYAEIEQCSDCYGLWFDKGEFKEVKNVRKYKRGQGKLEKYAQPTGVKKALLDFIETALGSIKSSF